MGSAIPTAINTYKAHITFRAFSCSGSITRPLYRFSIRYASARAIDLPALNRHSFFATAKNRNPATTEPEEIFCITHQHLP